MKNIIVVILALFLGGCGHKAYDVCIYGGTSAGVVAAYTAALYGKKVIIIEPSNHLGGLSSGGLGATDIGNKVAVTGISREFYRKLGAHYGNLENWTFEPKAAEHIFNNWASHKNITVIKQKYLHEVTKEGTKIKSITIGDIHGNNLKSIPAHVFIDCSYEGDLLAKAGVSYTIGREANSVYGETLNGYQMFPDKFFGDKELGNNYHQFPDHIDPYVEKGKPESGLLYGINGIADSLKANGTGDTLLQAYNYRLCLTNLPENKIEFTKPEQYNANNYELLRRVFDFKQQRKHVFTIKDYLLITEMPCGKTDVNNKGPMSTDFIGMNHNYPNASYIQRKKIDLEHQRYIEGLLYFLANDSGVPQSLQQQVRAWGWAKDEFIDNNNFPHQIYVREARRMISDYVMTEHNCRGSVQITDAVGMAAYTMDSHHTQRFVINGMVKNEGDVQVHAGPPYPISYQSIVPKAIECTNLLVPLCLSASHIAYGSIRMEPVFMVLAQSAALASVMAIDQQINVQNVDIKALQSELRTNPYADGRVPDIFVDDTDQTEVTFSDGWELKPWGYKAGARITSTKGSFVEIKPKIESNGNYDIYLYKYYQENSVLKGSLQNGNQNNIFEVPTTGINSNWIKIGNYQLESTKPFTVKIECTGENTFFDSMVCIKTDN